LVEKHAVKVREKDEAIFGSFSLEDREVVLFFPQTFMNESGRTVGPFARYRNIPLDHILVVSDDLDLPPGRLRLKPSGGSGGHHGLDSLISHLGGTGFPRLRIGVGKPPTAGEGAHHVLSGFPPEEKEKVEKAIERAAEGIEICIQKGAEAAMNEVNKELE
jgi:PTH1 family peptidyl-tRNA hydrolase